MLSVYYRGATTGDRLLSHEGEGCAPAPEGTMELRLGHETHTLKEGGSILFECAVPHRVTNIGRRALRAIGAITRPSL
ncbi:MAG TPA: cupin domain-containing protein [Candidatus Methylomirabilis sp.]|jgi:hypothetical protein